MVAATTVNRIFCIHPQNDKDLVRLSRKLNVSKSELVREGISLLCEKYGLKAA